MNITEEYISGSKGELINEIKETIKELKKQGYEEEEISDYQEILDDLQALKGNGIYSVNNNNGMGFSINKLN